MKEISSQLYGLEAELDSTSETNGTTCFCVDTGTVFVAYGGIWYEQRNVYWKVGGAAESDLSGYSRYMPSAAAVDDLVCFNAMDTGDRYVAYCGHWFKQPVPWSDTALLDAAAAQSGGGASVFTVTFTPTDEDWTTFTVDKTIAEIEAAYEEGAIIQGRFGTEEGGYNMLNLGSIVSGLAIFERSTVLNNDPPTLVYTKLVVYSGGVNYFGGSFELTPSDAPV